MLGTVAKKLLPAPVQSYLRAVKRKRSMAGFQPRVVRHRYGPATMAVALKDGLAEKWYDCDWSEPSELAFLKQRSLKPGATVFDLGAHQCVVALMLAHAVGEAGRVVALEANSHNAAVARENVALNRAGNLVVLHAAAAARRGELTFNESLNGQVDDGAATHGQVTVPARSVDDLAAEYGQPHLVFIDVEGFECEVLSGAATVLAKGTDVFVEVHGGAGLEKFGGSVAGLLAHLPPTRFELFHSTSENEPFRPLDIASIKDGTRWFLIAIHRTA